MRPILSNTGMATYKIAKYLNKPLCDGVLSKSEYIFNQEDLVRSLRERDLVRSLRSLSFVYRLSK